MHTQRECAVHSRIVDGAFRRSCLVELRRFELLTPSMRTVGEASRCGVVRGEAASLRSARSLAHAEVAVLCCCTAVPPERSAHRSIVTVELVGYLFAQTLSGLVQHLDAICECLSGVEYLWPVRRATLTGGPLPHC